MIDANILITKGSTGIYLSKNMFWNCARLIRVANNGHSFQHHRYKTKEKIHESVRFLRIDKSVCEKTMQK